MSDIGINWGGLVQRTNPFAEFQQGMERGQDRRLQEERANLFAREQQAREQERQRAQADDQENRLERGILGHVARTDPRAAAAKAVEVGQYDQADQFAKLDANQRKVARDNAEDLGGFAATIQQVPYEQRRAIIAQARPTLESYGFKPEQIDGFDPTDEALQGLIASSMDLTQALAEQNRQRDDKRADQRDHETQAYRAEMLALAGKRQGLAERREGRVAAGGGGGGKKPAAGPRPTGRTF